MQQPDYEAQMKNKDLSKEWRVLAAIRQYAYVTGPTDGTKLTQKRIAELTGISAASVSKAVELLKKQGFIEATEEKENDANS